jgi:outer membrane protein assembly complex protein YaeT
MPSGVAAALASAWLSLGPLPGPPPTGAPAGAPQAGSPAGKIVRAIDLRSPHKLAHTDDLASMVELHVGEPWRDADVRHTLRNLYLTGGVSEAEAYAEPADDGVRAVFALWPSIEVRSVAIAGKLGLSRTDLTRALAVRVAEPLVEDRVLRSVLALQDLYQDQGYAAAKVHLHVKTDDAASATDIVFEVDAGPRTHVDAVALAGDLGPLKEADVLGKRSPVGKPYQGSTARDEQDRIERALHAKGYRLAEVDEAKIEPQGTNGVRLIYAVRLGPLVEAEVKGASLEALQKKGLLPFLGDEGYDEALVLQSIDRIRADYQARGNYQVRVDRQETRSDTAIHLTLTIDPGPLFVLDNVKFTGNAGVSERQLSELMTTSPRRLLRPGSGRLVDATLKEDLANIRSYYALQGYTRVRVGPEVVEARERGLTLTVPIVEGPRSTVHAITLVGVAKLPEASVRDRLALRQGGPYHALLLQDSINAVRSLYDDQGYDAAQISAAVSWNDDHTLADVRLDVLEGPQSRLDRVIVRGNVKTDEDVVRKFVDLKPGEPLSRQRLLEVQHELYRLGVFSRVDFDVLSTTDDSAQRDVRLRLEEGSFRRYIYGVGYDSEKGVSGALGFSHVNLFGRALSFQADVKVSQLDNQLRLLLSEPYLGPYKLPVRLSLFRVEEKQDSFDSRRRGLQVEVERQFGALRLGGLYTYKIVNTLNLASGISIDQIERDLTPVEIASVTGSALYDKRDDPIDPHRGYSLATQLEWAFPVFSAHERFLKSINQATYQHPVGKLGVAAASFRLGAIEAYEHTCQEGVTVLDPAACPIPLSERFFAGGRSTNRAYARDALGIPGDTLSGTTPLGGTGLALVNLDYRFPVYGAFGGVVFADSGNVWGDWRAMRLADFKNGVGLGVRYASPVGPVRLEVGWKLDRAPGESPYQIYFSFGTPF